MGHGAGGYAILRAYSTGQVVRLKKELPAVASRYGPNMGQEEDIPTTGNTLADTAADLFGTVLGFSVPIGAGGQTIQLGRAVATSLAAAKVLSKAPGKIATHTGRALEGAVGGAAYGAYRSGVEDLSPKEAAKMIIGEPLYGPPVMLLLGDCLRMAPPKALQYVRCMVRGF